jgi:CheY-like chemotaxis protein
VELVHQLTQQSGLIAVPAQQRRTVPIHSIRVLIADDEPDIRHLISLTLGLDGDDLVLLPAVDDGAAALAAWRGMRPDVLVLDQRMPELTGLDVACAVLAEDPEAAIVLFSASLDALTVRRAEALGVTCLDKTQVHRLAGVVRELDARRRLATES